MRCAIYAVQKTLTNYTAAAPAAIFDTLAVPTIAERAAGNLRVNYLTQARIVSLYGQLLSGLVHASSGEHNCGNPCQAVVDVRNELLDLRRLHLPLTAVPDQLKVNPTLHAKV